MLHVNLVNCRQETVQVRACDLRRTGVVPAPAQPPRPSMVILAPGAALLAVARSAPPRPSEPRYAARGGSEREHAADQSPPGQRADDPVDGDSERLLEAAHRGRGL